MTFTKLLLWAILAYVVYKFVFRFLIPLLKVSRQMKQQIRDYQQQAGRMQQNSPFNNNNTRPPEPEKRAEKTGEYIDFEEIKEK